MNDATRLWEKGIKADARPAAPQFLDAQILDIVENAMAHQAPAAEVARQITNALRDLSPSVDRLIRLASIINALEGALAEIGFKVPR